MPNVSTNFRDPGDLRDGNLELRVRELAPANILPGFVPAYHFDMIDADTGDIVGRISLRLGDTEHLVQYGGQIAYGVEEPHRGHRYAARACRLLFPLAFAHGIDPLWITCNPDNIASRRTCELAGGELVEIVDLPTDCDMYEDGERQKCRFRFSTGGARRAASDLQSE